MLDIIWLPRLVMKTRVYKKIKSIIIKLALGNNNNNNNNFIDKIWMDNNSNSDEGYAVCIVVFTKM